VSFGAAGLEIVLAALVVGLDNFAVAVALAALGDGRRTGRIAVTFAAFGGVAPAVGALAGQELSEPLAGFGEIAAALVLLGVGLWTIRSGLHTERLEETARRFSSGGGLLALSLGLSTDNLAVGFGLGLHGTRALPLAAATTLSVLVLSLLGLRLGISARERWERRSLLAAGLLLIGLAVWMAVA
jgi:manganese efflux pump family protein